MNVVRELGRLRLCSKVSLIGARNVATLFMSRLEDVHYLGMMYFGRQNLIA